MAINENGKQTKSRRPISSAVVGSLALAAAISLAGATPASASDGPIDVPPPPTCELKQSGYVDGGVYNWGKVFERTERIRVGGAIIENVYYDYLVQVPNIPAGLVPIGHVEKLCETRYIP